MFHKNSNFWWWMATNAALAYLTNLLNFLVTKYTSALTLQVCARARVCVCVSVCV